MQVQDLQQSLAEAHDKMADGRDKADLKEAGAELERAMKELHAVVHEPALNRVR
jgi:hypothetical protein